MSVKNFNSTPNIKLHRSTMDLSHERRLDADPFILYPIHVQECVPGDHFSLSIELVLRMNPAAVPFMHRIDAYTHTYFVAYRTLHENQQDFENMISGGPTGRFSDVTPRIRYVQPGTPSSKNVP